MHPAEEKTADTSAQYCLFKVALHFKANQSKPCPSEFGIISSEDYLAETQEYTAETQSLGVGSRLRPGSTLRKAFS